MVSSAQRVVSATRLLLLGPPGAGKGTQAKLLAEELSISHIASGDLFRHHEREGTPLGIKAMEYMTQGLLVPDEITIAMVLEQVLPPAGQTAFLLDGFPRNLVQARTLDEALEGRGRGIDRTILIQVAAEELVRRLSGRLVCRQCEAPYHSDTAPPNTTDRCDLCGGELYQRQDDTPEAVTTRIRVYQEETEPLKGYYARSGKLVEVDGHGTAGEVTQRILKSLQS